MPKTSYSPQEKNDLACGYLTVLYIYRMYVVLRLSEVPTMNEVLFVAIIAIVEQK